MVVAGSFKNGVTFDMNGNVMQVIEFQHVKPGKGAAFVRTKLRNVITGAVTETTFNPTDKFEDARVDRKEMQYLYSDGELYYFMDMETYEQIPLNADKLSDNFKFVKEEMICTVKSYKGNVFAVEPPMFVELRDYGDRRGRKSSLLHLHGREDQDRHENGRISRKSVRRFDQQKGERYDTK